MPQNITFLPKSTLVGNFPLWRYRQFKDVVIPDFITKIEDNWFAGSGIESIWIPDGVQELGNKAF